MRNATIPPVLVEKQNTKRKSVREWKSMTFRIPPELEQPIDEWLADHPGHTKASMILNGLAALGLPVLDADKTPHRRDISALTDPDDPDGE